MLKDRAGNPRANNRPPSSEQLRGWKTRFEFLFMPLFPLLSPVQLHCCGLGAYLAVALSAATSIGAPSYRKLAPEVTTCSPARSPSVMRMELLRMSPVFTARVTALPSWTTKTPNCLSSVALRRVDAWPLPAERPSGERV